MLAFTVHGFRLDRAWRITSGWHSYEGEGPYVFLEEKALNLNDIRDTRIYGLLLALGLNDAKIRVEGFLCT